MAGMVGGVVLGVRDREGGVGGGSWVELCVWSGRVWFGRDRGVVGFGRGVRVFVLGRITRYGLSTCLVERSVWGVCGWPALGLIVGV